MKMLQMTLVIAASTILSACGGTDTGNALQSDIIVGTSSDSAPATDVSSSSLRASSDNPTTLDLTEDSADQPLSEITLTKAQVYVRQVAAPFQPGCSVQPGAKKSWSISRDAFLIDWLVDTDSSPLTLSFSAGFTTCQIRMIAAPSADKSTPSILIEGSTALGTQFSITSELPHLFVMHTSKPTNFQTDADANLEMVFYLKDSFTGAQIDALGATSIAITPATHPVLFAGFLKNLRKNLRAHPFKKVNGQVEKHRETTLGAGDETEDTLKDGELDN